MFRHNCQKHGHRYEARFDKRFPVGIMDRLAKTGNIPEIIEAMKETIYIHDLCTRCGHVIERKA